MKSMECYADAIVLRHPVEGSAAIAAASVDCPVLNAGDGTGEHPTQALLDLYTIFSEMNVNELKNVVITMVGDLKHGRTVHSLAKLLAMFHVELNYVAPGMYDVSLHQIIKLVKITDQLQMPDEIIQELQQHGVKQLKTNDLKQVVATSDVIYVTRIQKERFNSATDYEAVKDSFLITPETIESAKPKMVLMHPLPRVNEISTLVDQDPRAAYFRQMKNGMFVRMALLNLLLNS